MARQRLGRVAFITTPNFRDTNPEIIDKFILSYFYTLCNLFEVVSTGGTFEFIKKVLKREKTNGEIKNILKKANLSSGPNYGIKLWEQCIRKRLKKVEGGVIGMINLGYDLVESRLDAIIHFSDWDDVIGKPDSMVLRREANVHNVPIATDYYSAVAAVKSWNSTFASTNKVFHKKVKPSYYPLKGLTEKQNNIALIAHDKMKLTLCCFFVKYADKIFNEYHNILATGTTGSWLINFSKAMGKSKADISKIRCCKSGPYGGDVQIAAAVVKGLCKKVLFLQDPHTSHPHEIDIKLFEQAMLLFRQVATSTSNKIKLELATNLESAKVLIGKR